ncbi:hypothetical protein KA012_04730 [Candidatus Woesebacteria bacterium]|nr:hypothetical protein [Candidatus Woesebacteria bacterium]
MPASEVKPSLKDLQLTRREFLKLAARTAIKLLVIAVFLGSSEAPPPESGEAIKQLPPQVAFIDFGLDKMQKLTAGLEISQSEHASNHDLLQTLLGDNDPDLISKLQIFLASRSNEAEVLEYINTQENPRPTLVWTLLQQFRSHALDVIEAHTAALEQNGLTAPATLIPLQSAFELTPRQDAVDNLGNPSVTLTVTAQPLIDRLRQFPNLAIVNLSFQVGEITTVLEKIGMDAALMTTLSQRVKELEARYEKRTINYTGTGKETVFRTEKNPDPNKVLFIGDSSQPGEIQLFWTSKDYNDPNKKLEPAELITEQGWEEILLSELGPLIPEEFPVSGKETPDIVIQGAYSGEKTIDNLRVLFKLADAFPEKLFVVALGNYGDDIREARNVLVDEWPENILFVGHWNHFTENPYFSSDKRSSDGADLFVDHIALGEKMIGSSVSTAIVSARAVALKHAGITLPGDLKNALIAQGRPVSYKSPTKTREEAWSKRITLGLDELPTEEVSTRVIGIT